MSEYTMTPQNLETVLEALILLRITETDHAHLAKDQATKTKHYNRAREARQVYRILEAQE